MFYQLLRPILFLLPPEAAHSLSLYALHLLPKIFFKQAHVKSVEIMGLRFPNPVGLAAGLDKNADHLDALAKLGFGFIEVGTVTPKPQPGNPKPRLFRLPKQQALINRMGFNNKGVDYLIEQVKKAKYKGILGINIGKNFTTPIEKAHQDYLHCFRKVYPYASYITINISSPNTPGLRHLQFGEHLHALLSVLKQTQEELAEKHGRYVPVALKIAPDLTDQEIEMIAQALLQHNIDAVIATNTTTSRDTVANLRFGNEAGGLSGKPLTALSTKVIKTLKQHLSNQIPIIAAGGIMSATDATEKLNAGAALVQLYTGLIYQGPQLISEINQSVAQA